MIKGKVLGIKNWNYNTIISNNINNDILFYTNNIVESFNNNINKKFIGFCKTMHNFKLALKDVVTLYEMNGIYKEKKLSITRALEHYVRIKNEFDLITFEELLNIKKEYKKYLESNNQPIDQEEDNDSELSDYYIKKKKLTIFLLIVKVVFLKILNTIITQSIIIMIMTVMMAIMIKKSKIKIIIIQL